MGIRPPSDQPAKVAPLDFLRLRPYGSALATPAVQVWLGFAWVVILLMASIEGIVWGLVGASIVPDGMGWMSPFSGLFMFLLMFSIIWVVDASLIISERPLLRARRWSRGAGAGVGATIRWTLGIVARLAIVAVSLYVTAPFLAKLIRADDIVAYHQTQVERYYAQRQSRLQTQIDARAEQVEALYRERVTPLEAEIARLGKTLAEERTRRDQIEAEYAPEIAILRSDLAATQQLVGDEILGRNGREKGRGPKARKWEANASHIAEQLAAKEAERDSRIATISERIAGLERTLQARSSELQSLATEHRERLARIASEVASQQVAAMPPHLTFAARSKALQALRNSPEERGVPHFETVEGFAQAALGVLFFSLIALKLFEPPAVRAYFSENVQAQYRKYLEGGLGDIPGFELPPRPEAALNPVEFARLWEAFEKDPASFYADRRALVEVREPLTRFLAEQSLERELLAQRKEGLDQEVVFARRRRELELAAYERELAERTAQLQAQLGNETRALHNHRRIELAAELQRAREDWTRSKALEEEELRQRRESFEQERKLVREELRLREQEIANLRDKSEAEIRQAEVARQLAHQHKLAVLQAKQRRDAYQARLKGTREEVARLRTLEAKQTAERQALREGGRKLKEAIELARLRIQDAEQELAAQQAQSAGLGQQLEDAHREAETRRATRRFGFWSWGKRTAERKVARKAKRDLKGLEKAERIESGRLAKLREELRGLEVRWMTHEGELYDAEARVSSTQARIGFYEDSLSRLLCSADEEEAPPPSATSLPDADQGHHETSLGHPPGHPDAELPEVRTADPTDRGPE